VNLAAAAQPNEHPL